jgi:hypothetical protein
MRASEYWWRNATIAWDAFALCGGNPELQTAWARAAVEFEKLAESLERPRECADTKRDRPED